MRDIHYPVIYPECNEDKLPAINTALAGTLHDHTYTMAMEWAGLSVVYYYGMANIGIGHIVCSLYVCMFKDIL